MVAQAKAGRPEFQDSQRHIEPCLKNKQKSLKQSKSLYLSLYGNSFQLVGKEAIMTPSAKLFSTNIYIMTYNSSKIRVIR